MDGTVDPVTNPMGALQALVGRGQDFSDAQAAQLAQLQQAKTRAPEYDEAERWGAMAKAAAAVPPVQGAFGQLLANIGGAYTQALGAQEQRRFDREAKIAQLMGRPDEARLLSALVRGQKTVGAGTGKFVPVPGVPGLMTNNVTGEKLDLRDAASAKQVQDLFKALRSDYATDDEAMQAAFHMLGRSGGSKVAAPQSATQTTEPAAAPAVELAPGTDRAAYSASLKRMEDQAVAEGDYAKAREIQQVRMTMGEQPTGAMPQRKDKGADEARTKYKTGQAEDLQKMYSGYSDSMTKNSSLIGNLNMLESLYTTPDMPEGKAGPLIQDIRSGMKSLGVEVGENVGKADMAKAISQKMALELRTADGNLMPGAMSNFDVQTLMDITPGLSMTNEGRTDLIKFMKHIANERIKISEEATKFASKNKDNMLTSDWYARRERLAKESMIRTKLFAESLKKQHGVK